MRLISFIFFLLALSIALALGSENSQLVTVNLLFVKVQTSMSNVLVASAGVGVFITLMAQLISKVVNRKNA